LAGGHRRRDRETHPGELRTGKGMLKIVTELGVGSGTVQRAAREMRGDRPFGESAAA
jgi:hypothetical protein